MHWPEDFPIGVGVVGGLVGYKTVSAGAWPSLCQNFKSSMLFDLYQLHDMEEIYELE